MQRQEIYEHEQEWARLTGLARGLIRRHATTGALEREIMELREPIGYAHQRWQRHGRWCRYYQVNSGALHCTLRCRTINIHTVVRSMPHLAGVLPNTVARQHKLCSHCHIRATSGWDGYRALPEAFRSELLAA